MISFHCSITANQEKNNMICHWSNESEGKPEVLLPLTPIQAIKAVHVIDSVRSVQIAEKKKIQLERVYATKIEEKVECGYEDHNQWTTESSVMSSFSFNKLRNFLPHSQNGSAEKINQRRHSVSLEPEIGFQLTLGSCESSNTISNGDNPHPPSKAPELNINLIAARHLPSTFGFKVVQGYEIKVCVFAEDRWIWIFTYFFRWNCFLARRNMTAKFRPTLGPNLTKISSFH